MNGNKWADYIITEVYQDNEKRILLVKIGLDSSNYTIDTKMETRSYVIDLLKSGKSVVTSRKISGTYYKGAIVEYYKESNGLEYLRTISNGDVLDNLDNLPKF